MRIEDIQPNQKVPYLKAQIIQLKPTIKLPNGGVRDALIEDETGTVTLTLWHAQCDEVSEGSIIIIHNGWAKTYQPREGPPYTQITTGRTGRLEVIP